MNRYDQEIYGSVGGAEVQPRYIGSAEVQPRYVGASAVDTGALTGDTVNYSGIQYRAGDISYFGMGSTTVPAANPAGPGQITTPPLVPNRPITPQRLGLPSNIQGLLINVASIGGINLFASSDGIPVEMFSEVSTFPQIMWPTIEPSTGIVWQVTNPTAAPLEFKPTFYGTQVRR